MNGNTMIIFLPREAEKKTQGLENKILKKNKQQQQPQTFSFVVYGGRTQNMIHKTEIASNRERERESAGHVVLVTLFVSKGLCVCV